ncbi:uncharacterized protein MELLADRAFT_85575 [Melampsora larici-populina 98AG31]|uniref:Uncharacterized protein n=1 Tax=Melampsora larici-populina (strain 98AG31 / pathotype 3-4-7) TaxID=747676 RepID=F4RIE7_MELLP|nr:uncharacterized protein MELLADRAFT_85575 [Melampsora larici-populina 98AG31]EGG07688.1 hypothetical protein MELLADRAFT_85575 [Melampsora larici-populina 98AG31]
MRSKKPPPKPRAKRTPAKASPTPKSKPKAKPRNSKSNKSKKTDKNQHDDDKLTSSDENADENHKTTVHWDNDDNGEGKSLMYLLINWLTDEDNFTRFKTNKTEKRGSAEEIEEYLIKNGILWRDATAIKKKEVAWRRANDVRNQTGSGSWNTCKERKAIEGLADDDPKWLSMEKVALAPILKKCKYYFELEPVFETRHGNTRLAASHSLLDEGEENFTQSQRNSREHSVNSNSAYQEYHNNDDHLERDPFDDSLNSNLAHKDDHLPHEDLLDDLDDDIPQTFKNNNDDLEELINSNPITPSRPSQSRYQRPISSTSMKRTSSKASLPPASQVIPSKRAPNRKSGSADSIQDLIQNNPLDAQLDSIQAPVSQQASQALSHLSRLADNVAITMLPDKPTLNEDDSKKKAKIELEMADVQLSSEKKKLEEHDFNLSSKKEKHLLEMQNYKAELEHQQITRNAQLISMLMRENNWTLQEAMIAAQTAQAMQQSSSSK